MKLTACPEQATGIYAAFDKGHRLLYILNPMQDTKAHALCFVFKEPDHALERRDELFLKIYNQPIKLR